MAVTSGTQAQINMLRVCNRQLPEAGEFGGEEPPPGWVPLTGSLPEDWNQLSQVHC